MRRGGGGGGEGEGGKVSEKRGGGRGWEGRYAEVVHLVKAVYHWRGDGLVGASTRVCYLPSKLPAANLDE